MLKLLFIYLNCLINEFDDYYFLTIKPYAATILCLETLWYC